jgi:hypothetical protein
MKWNELRAVLFIKREREDGLGTFTQVVKVGLDGALGAERAVCETSEKQNTPKELDDFGRDLEVRGFCQRGCFVGDDKAWAVAWLRQGYEPEYLSEAMGQRIVPATLMWHFSTGNTLGHIYSSLGAGYIQRSRARNPSSQDDLAVRELPTLEQRLKAYGL